MHHFFRVIWSHARNALVVVPEVGPAGGGHPLGRGQKTRKALQTLRVMAFIAGVLIAPVALPQVALAQVAADAVPQGGQVVAGQSAIHSAPGALVIHQTSERAVINWDSFDIGRDATVTFRQPGRSSTALNRVTNAAPSQVLGQLNANGQVFVTNRNGVYFGRGARVNVGGLVATTHDTSDDDFMRGQFRLNRDGATGAVINDGALRAADGGYIALLAPEVRNRGVITARLGTVALAAGEAYELSMGEDGALAGLRVEPAQIETLVENGHLIKAPGGKVIMSAGAARELRAGVIRNTGTIEARGIQRSGGRVFLGGGRVQTTRRSRIVASVAPLQVAKRPVMRPADAPVHIQGNTVELAGQIDTSGTIGGTIAIEGGQIDIADNTWIAAMGTLGGGDVLIGGDWQGGTTTARVFAEADAMRQAQSLHFAAGARVDASATRTGDGGTIALWSSLQNGTTQAHGSLRAEAGAAGGDGGRIETSGLTVDVAGIAVSTRAPQGAVGDWLLDPGNITIESGGPGALPGGAGPGADVSIDPTTIEAALNGSNVTITTGAAGDFTLQLDDPITYAGADERTLTLGASGRMLLQNNITSTGGALNLILASEIDRATTLPNDSGHGVTVTGGMQIDTQGGDVWIGGGQLTDTWNGHTVGIGTSMGRSSNQNSVDFNANLSTGGGDLLIAANTDSGTAASIVTTQPGSTIDTGSGDITFVTDLLDFFDGTHAIQIDTTGSFTLRPFSGEFNADLTWDSTLAAGYYDSSSTLNGRLSGLRIADTLGGLHLGAQTNDRDIVLTTDLSVAGPISLAGEEIAIDAALLSTAAGDIDLIGTRNSSDSVVIGPTGAIAKTAGSGTLTMRGGSRVRVEGPITASGTGVLNVVLWSDYDHTADGGGVSIKSPIATNGGHLWAGGSSTAEGSYTWNGLTVGDGASVGGALRNANALDLYASINTGGGDALFWAGDGFGVGVDGIGVSGGATAEVITGSGDVTIIADEVLGTQKMMLDNTGTTTFAPYDGAFSEAFAFGWAYDGPDGELTATKYNAIRFRDALVGGLNIGSYDGMLNGGVPVELSNTADVSLVTGSYFRGDVSFTGGTVDINESMLYQGNLSLTANSADVLIGRSVHNRASQPSTATISAVRHIDLEGAGSLSANNATNMHLRADSDADGGGIIYIEGALIDTHGGDLDFGDAGATAVIGGQAVRVGGDVFFQRNTAQTVTTRDGDVNIYGETIVGNTAGLTINSDAGDVTLHGMINAGNGYEYVDKTANSGTGSWTDARIEARGGSGGGAAVGDSYLVNITSRLENSIAGLAAGYVGAWIGAWRANPAGSYNWSFADGPEAGQHFFTQVPADGGTAEPGFFSNFGASEPNGHLSAIHEHVGQLYGSDGLWNDLSPNTTYRATMDQPWRVLGFVRETNLAGAPLTIDAGTGEVTIDGAVGSKKPFGSLDITASNTEINGPALVVEGTVDVTGPLTVAGGNNDLRISASAVNVDGAVTVSGLSVTQDAPLTGTSTVSMTSFEDIAVNQAVTGGDDVTLEAGSKIAVQNDVTTNGGHLVLWTDTNEVGGDDTSIRVQNSTITTAGGGVWMGGSHDSNGTGTAWAAGNGDTLTVGDGYAANGANTTNPAGIFLENGSITTSGGNIALYGYSLGNAAGTHGYGLNIRGQTFDTGGGDLIAEGVFNQTAATIGTAVGLHMIAANGVASSASTGAGDLSLTGITGAASRFDDGAGMYLSSDVTGVEPTAGGLNLSSTTGDITLHGRAERAVGGGWSLGVGLISAVDNGTPNDVSITTTTGDLSITGEVEDDLVGTVGIGIGFANNADSGATQHLSTDGGSITLSGQNGPYNNMAIDFHVFSAADGLVIGDANTGDVTLRGDRIGPSGAHGTVVDTAETLTVEPLGASFEVSPDLNTFSFAGRTGGLMYGKPGNQAAYFSTRDLDIGGDVTFYTGASALDDDIVADGAVQVTTATGGIATTAEIDAGSDVSLISTDDALQLSGEVASHGDVLFKAAGSITQVSGSTVDTTGGDITYWADSDGADGGSVQMVGGSNIASFVPDVQIRSRGGDILIGGGSASAGGKPTGAAGSTVAERHGVRLLQTLLDASVAGTSAAASSGNVTIRGTSARTGGAGTDLARGVMAMNTRIYANQLVAEGTHTTADPSTEGLSFLNHGQINAHGDITLSGTHTLGGDALSLDANHVLSSAAGDITVNADGVLSAVSTTPLALASGQTVTVNSISGTGNWTTAITGAGDVVKAGAGTLNLDGAQSYSGGTQVDAGTLTLATDLSNSVVTIAPGAEMALASAQQIGGLSGAGDVDLGAHTLTTGVRGLDLTFSGILNGTGGVQKTGTGRLTLTGANTYTGDTLISDGTLALGTGGALVGDIINNSALVVDNTDSITLGGVISGTGTVAKNGSGTLTLSGANTYDGLTHVTEGTLAASHNSALGAVAGGTTVADGAVLGLTGGITVTEPVTLNEGAELAFGAGSNRVSGDVTLTGDATFTTIGGLQFVSGDVAAAGHTLTFDNDGNIRAFGAVTAGVLSLGGSGGVTFVDTGHQVDELSTYETIGTLNISNTGALRIGAAGIASTGNVSVSTQTGDLTLAGDVTANGPKLLLVAGRSNGPGTATGGNLLINGMPNLSVRAGGQLELYSGSVSGSTGLTDLVGAGSGRFRYNSSFTIANYTEALPADVPNAIYRETIALTGSTPDHSITYGDASPASTGDVTGMVNGDTGSIIVNAPVNSTSGTLAAGSYDISAATHLGALGYDVTAMTDGTLTVAPKTINATGVTADDKTYDTTDTATLTGALALSAGGANALDGAYLNGDAVGLSAGTTHFADPNAGVGKTVSFNGVGLTGADAGNYLLSLPSLSADINRRVVGLSAARVYDGTTDLSGDVTVTTGTGETLNYTDANALDPHVATPNNYIAGLTLTDGTGLASNYALPVLNVANAPVTITPRQLNVTLGNAGITKAYDSTSDAPDGFIPTYLLTGFANGDTGAVLSHMSASFDSADVATASQLVVSGLGLDSITGAVGSFVSDYALPAPSVSAAAAITPAPLSVTANNHAKFVTFADVPGYAGVRYEGFVGGETAAVLGGALNIVRSNAATNAAGVYAEALQPSGLTSDNYAITFQPGTFSIVPSNQLWAEITDQTHAYGSQTPYAATRVTYFDGVTVFRLDNGSVPGSSVTISPTNVLVAQDGAGGSATMQLAPDGAGTSGAGEVTVGAYQVGVDGLVTENSVNFSDVVTVTGTHTVTRQQLTPSVVGGLSRVYDGTRNMSGATIGMGAIEAGDTVTISGTGTYDTADAGAGKSYSVSGVALSGADAANYELTTGNTLSGVNGELTQRVLAVTYGGVNRVYDGSTDATVTTSDDRLAGDALIINRTASFDTKNVGTGKTVNVAAVSLAGADAGNYSVAATGTTTADITRLGSVTWVGGAAGNWHDPANWQGGAVPDLSNVAHVVIPNGITITFGTPPVVPAEAGPVNVDGIGNSGTLVMTDGVLNVGTDGVVLQGLEQTRGTLTSAGGITVQTLEQTGGDTTTSGLTVGADFTQSGPGTISVTGNADLTDSIGGLHLGNLTVGGNLQGVSTDGPITQSGGTVLTVHGTTTLTAQAGGTPEDVTLDAPTNNLGGPVNVTGDQITLNSNTGLTLHNVNAQGDLTVTAQDDLNLTGNITVDAADLTSTGGSVTQSGGTVHFASGPNTITAQDEIVMTRPGNMMQGGLTTTGSSVTLTSDVAGALGIIDRLSAQGRSARSGQSAPHRAGDPPRISVERFFNAGADVTGVQVEMLQQASGTQPSRVVVTMPQDLLRRGLPFVFELPEDIRQQVRAGVQPRAERMDGKPLPNWLSFDPGTLTFAASNVPAGALPMTLRVIIGSIIIEVLVQAE